MVTKNIIIFFLIGFMTVLPTNHIFNQNCFSKSQKELLIKEILCQKEVYQYLHLNNPKRTPLKLKSNPEIPESLNIIMNSEKVIIDNANYVDQIELHINEIPANNEGCTIKFSFVSKIEGAALEGIALKKNKGWEIKILKHIEI